MRIEFPYPHIPALEVPDRNLLGYHHPQRFPDAPPADDQVRQALAHSIGAPPLSDRVAAGTHVLIIVDDNTRPTPAAQLLPPLLDALKRAGVNDSGIAFLIACGSHRKMTGDELERKLGKGPAGRYPVHQHDYDDADLLVDCGEIDGGLPVLVNRHVVAADFVIGLGHIVPHRAQGMSGGAKIMLPGVAGKASVDGMHWRASQIPIPDLLGKIDNPLRRLSNAFAGRAGLDYIVNVVLDDEERVVGAWAGDPVAAHREGCRKALDVYGIQIPEPADICVIDSYPADVDLWQANKALFAAEPAVKPGGVVILVTPSPEGASKAHPKLVDLGYHPLPEVKQMIEKGKIHAGASAAALADGGEVFEKATGILVSPGIDPESQKKLGFTTAETPHDALERAFGLRGRDATVLAIHHGGEIVPLVGGR